MFLRRLVSTADADDIAQEVFLVTWSRADTYRGSASVRSWLFAIAWRKAKDSQRRVFRRRRREALYHRAESVNELVQASMEERLSVQQALMSLPIEQRAACRDPPVLGRGLLACRGCQHARPAARYRQVIRIARSRATARSIGARKVSIDFDERIAALLSDGAPPQSDPIFRIKVLERRERQRFRRKSVSLAIASLALIASVWGTHGVGASLAEAAAIVLLCAALGALFVYGPVVMSSLRRYSRKRGPPQNA